MAVVNLFTKQNATILGPGFFTLVFYAIFTVSEKINKLRKFAHVEQQNEEHFHLLHQENDRTRRGAGASWKRAGNGARLQHTLNHLRWTLETHGHLHRSKTLLVMEARLTGYEHGAFWDLAMEQIFGFDFEQERLFTRKAVSIAESYGKTISPAGCTCTRDVLVSHCADRLMLWSVLP